MLIACLSVPHSLIASCKSSVLMAETTGQATSQKTNNKIFVICYFSMWLPRWLSGKKKISLPMQETQETQVQSLGQEELLEKNMANHSSILAWRILRTKEHGGLLLYGL